MFEAMATQMLLTGGILGVSALASAGGVMMLRAPREAKKTIDVDAMVRNAPYERLHNIVSVQNA